MSESSQAAKATAINDELRTAAMNRRYYACRLASVLWWNRLFDVVLAISTCAGIAAWNIWRTREGELAWKTFGAAATLIAISRPFLPFAKDIERYSELVIGYGALYYDMKQLLEDLRVAGSVNDELWARFRVIRPRMKELGIKDDLKPRKGLHRRCYNEVNQELPNTRLWWPEETNHEQRGQA